MTKMYRQGDVLIIKVDKLPNNLEPISPHNNNLNLLALGEASGHAHQIKAEDSVFYAVNDNLKVVAKKHGVLVDRNVAGGLKIMVDNTKVWHGTPNREATEPSDPDHDALNLSAGGYIVCLPREYSDEEEFVRVAD